MDAANDGWCQPQHPLVDETEQSVLQTKPCQFDMYVRMPVSAGKALSKTLHSSMVENRFHDDGLRLCSKYGAGDCWKFTEQRGRYCFLGGAVGIRGNRLR